jgi:hypothetical protein
MEYEKLEVFVSRARLDRYLISCSNSKERAQNLYEANLIVAQSFYPILNLFETFFRNTINNKLSIYFNDTAWIINQKRGFMDSPTLAPDFWLKSQVLNAERRTRGTITPGKIISEQIFGFWTSLFEKRHYKLIGGHVIHCFPNKPANINRAEIAQRLTRIREFRNRIYHNEAICFNNIEIDFTHSLEIKEDIYNLICWMDSDLMNYVHQFDRIETNINNALGI